MKLFRIVLCLLALVLGGSLAHATVTNSTSSTTIAGNGSQTVFTFNFIGVTANDITVIYTDTAGNQTIIPQGQYTLALNSALPGNVWGIGGSVTYPLIGSPIASGTTLTISRAVPNTQTVSSNQGTAFPTAVEAGLDLLAMQIQQLSATGHVVQASPADSCATLGFLPSAIQRANQVLGFDGTGCNPTAVSTLPQGTVSSAMQPVISAASLGAGRTAFGLGTMATEGIGAGLQDDGASNARVNNTTTTDSTSQSVTSAFHQTRRIASAAITYTLPASSTLWNGFGFWVTALTTQVVIAPNAADSFAGIASGNGVTIQAGSTAFVTTNGSGSWWLSGNQSVGMNAPLNMTLIATAASNRLTVAIKDPIGYDPSPTTPIFVAFRSQTLTGGIPVIGAITAPLSFTLNAASSMGCTTGVACRLWGELICQTESAGVCTSILVGLSAQSTANACYPLAEYNLQATGSGTGGGTTINTIQTSASALSNKAIRIAFYVEATWTTGVGWNASPTAVQLFGPGIQKPCMPLQVINSGPITTQTSCQTSQTQTGISVAITPTSAINLIKVKANVEGVGTTNDTAVGQISRGSTPTLIGNKAIQAISNTFWPVLALFALDNPATTSQITYYVYCSSSVNGAFAVNLTSGQSGNIEVEEIMGAIEPVNDNGQIRKAA